VIEPLRVDVDLACPADHAFTTWTERFAQWWPPGHTVSGDPAAIVLEPRLGGRIYERTHDGREIDWGEITSWEPPHGLAYRWHMRRDRGDATDVDIRFVPAAADTTRALGTQRLYQFLHENPAVEFLPVDEVNDPRVIANEDRFVSINATTEVDLVGQCASETVTGRYWSSSGGQADFARGRCTHGRARRSWSCRRRPPVARSPASGRR
jgi:uncharacterized protein YndB with AHSA1/START domain